MSQRNKTLQQQVNELTLECDLLRKKCVQNEEAYSLLLHQLKEMLRHRFGQKSERYIDLDDPQASLFDQPSTDSSSDSSSQIVETIEEDSESDDNVVDIKKACRKKKTNNGFSDHLPRTELTR